MQFRCNDHKWRQPTDVGCYFAGVFTRTMDRTNRNDGQNRREDRRMDNMARFHLHSYHVWYSNNVSFLYVCIPFKYSRSKIKWNGGFTLFALLKANCWWFNFIPPLYCVSHHNGTVSCLMFMWASILFALKNINLQWEQESKNNRMEATTCRNRAVSKEQ